MRFEAFTRFTEGQREYEITFGSSRAYLFTLDGKAFAQVYIEGQFAPTIIEAQSFRDVVRRACHVLREER